MKLFSQNLSYLAKFFLLSLLIIFPTTNITAKMRLPNQSTNHSILIIRAGFFTNLGNPIYSSCDVMCLVNLMWGTQGVNAYITEQSGNQMSINEESSQIVSVQLNRYAASLGCISNTWMQEALTALANQNIPTSGYSFYMLVIPESAGGGSCARSSGQAWTDSITGQGYSILRIPGVKWMFSSLARSMGIYSLQDYDNGGSTMGGDISDPTGLLWSIGASTTNPFEPMPGLNALHLTKLGWFPNLAENLVKINENTPTSSLKIASVSSALAGTHTPAVANFGNYWVSLRTNTGMDNALENLWSNRLYVHKVDNNNPLISHLVSSPLKAGDTFVDANNNAISFDALNGEVASVHFRKCKRSLPTLTIQSSGEGTLKVSIKNNDINCPNSRYRLSANCNGVACAFDPHSPTAPLDVWVNLVLDINYLENSYVLQFDDKIALSDTGANYRYPYLARYNVNPADIGRKLTFTIKDAYGDGICCQYGGGTYYEVGIGNAVMRHGGEFSFEETTTFLALPTTMLTLASSKSSSTLLSYTPQSSPIRIAMSLVQIGSDGQNNGRAVINKSWTSPTL